MDDSLALLPQLQAAVDDQLAQGDYVALLSVLRDWLNDEGHWAAALAIDEQIPQRGHG